MRSEPSAVAPPRRHWRECTIFLLCVCALINAGCSGPTHETRPPVDRLAEAEYRQQYQEFLATCLTDVGFPSELQDDGAVKIEHGGQVDEYHAAKAVCQEEFGPLPSAAPPSDAELSKFYDLQVESYECLVAQGLEPVPPPSRETFIATYMTDEAWDAYLPQNPQAPFLTSPACPPPQFEDIEW